MPKGIPKNGINKGWFKQGQSFWTGKKRPDLIGNSWNKGKPSWNKGLKLPQFSGENSSRWKGGKAKDSMGYTLHRKYGGYQLEHRYIIENLIGRKLTSDEVIHHINGIKTDNRIENLRIFKNHSEHIQYHWTLKIFRDKHK